MGMRLPLSGQFGEPIIECRSLFWLQGLEGDSHAQTSLGIDHNASGFELGFAFVNADSYTCAHWEGNHGIDETASRP
jgi:hypothetical protein